MGFLECHDRKLAKYRRSKVSIASGEVWGLKSQSEAQSRVAGISVALPLEMIEELAMDGQARVQIDDEAVILRCG